MVAIATWSVASGRFGPIAMSPAQSARLAEVEQSRYFAGCDEARAACAAPIYRGQPGYRAGMDGDDDGIACEPYR